MTTSAAETQPGNSFANIALTTSAGLWFLTAVAGQWAFVYYIFGRYYKAVAQGKMDSLHIIPGDGAGNVALVGHLLLAAIITFGGTIQLVPQIRAYALPLHRWNGRLFITVAFIMSASGLYMIWTRGTESPLVYRRLHYLREWSYEQVNEIFLGSAGKSGTAAI